MKKIVLLIACVVASSVICAQQLPDPHFEDWSATFNKDIQLKDWHGSNVSQLGFKFTFLFQKPGRTGYCAYVADREIGAFGIKETGPGYFSLGEAWQLLKGLSTGSATAGTVGGIAWKYRPDTISVWIKRTGAHTADEDFHILYYAWTGSSKGTQYKNKNGGATTTERINEESDIRQATDANEFGTEVKAKQVAEGWLRARAQYNNWTQIKVPIYYFNDAQPSMCNVIFSAGNYPAFRANDGLYDGNGLYVDDVELIYSSKIETLKINGVVMPDFNPNATGVQTFKVPNDEEIRIEGYRGAGKLKNIKGKTAVLKGRKLSDKEMTIQPGKVNGAPYVITVNAEDGSSQTVYKVKLTSY